MRGIEPDPDGGRRGAAIPRPTGARAAPEYGWTVVACAGNSCSADLGAALLARLGAVVRVSPHAVLVKAGCPFAPAACPAVSTAVFGKGVTLVAQRCTAHDRRPVGTAVIVGPVRTVADTDTVCRWLALGELDPSVLPERLLQSRSLAQARLN